MSPRHPSQQIPEPAAAGRRGQLFIVSAPSGAGKSTLCQSLRGRLTDLHYSVSYTTRPIREGEVDGVHYHFISETEFRSGIKESRWAEWATVHNNLYGTASADLNRILDAGGDILLDIDVQVTSNLPDQEMRTTGSTGVTYWEGSVSAKGTKGGSPITGEGYVELTGYAGRIDVLK